ncbi:MAG: hypothetical protein ACXVDN_15870 [Ktedonobacteraceae bacterium]
MRDPPHGQKQSQQQAVQVLPIHDPTGFDVPATTFAILERGLHTHTPGVELHLFVACTFIADQQPWFLIGWIPQQADEGLQRLFLPNLGTTIPAIATRCRTM